MGLHAYICAFLALSMLGLSRASVEYCCPALQLAVGNDKVFYPNSSSYAESAATYYATQEGQLSPYCYVKPTSPQDVSNAVKALALLNQKEIICPFAVRGGGHHTVIGIANIQNGVTIDLGNINATTLSSDKTIASVGAGARWGSVYSTLGAEGLAVLGGRGSGIGVGGFTTGGGISYFGAQYGFGCDKVQNFEIVLANGQITNANAETNSDLFAALKGGSNNFGIVTRFDLQTFELGQYFGGNNYYLGNESTASLAAFYSFVVNPDFDDKAGLILSTVYDGAQEAVIINIDFAYTEPIESPPVFVNFTDDIPIYWEGTSIANLTYFADVLDSYQPDGLRETSITATVQPDEELLQQIYLLWEATIPDVAGAQNLVYTLTFQPLAENMLAAGPLHGGNSLGLAPADGPLVALTLTAAYTDATSDDVILSTSRSLFAGIEALAYEANALNPWLYYNYADVTQPVIPSYGAANVAKMKAVSARVDPTGFFQKAQPGGFKL